LLGVCHIRARQWDSAIAALTQCVKLDTECIEGWQNLADACDAIGRVDLAKHALTQVLTIAQDRSGAADNDAERASLKPLIEKCEFRLAAMQAASLKDGNSSQALMRTPDHAPAGFVRDLFNQMAGEFDSHLQDHLGYAIPQQLVALLKTEEYAAVRKGLILDCGCGTGLFAQRAREAGFQATIDGCDLAPNMVERAQASKAYRNVKCEALGPFLKSYAFNSVDAVIATDVFVYVGDLTECFTQAARVLQADGVFAFSVEGADGSFTKAAQLRASGRFAHHPKLIEALANRHSFRVASMQATVIRTERAQPIDGFIAVLVKQ
jgi:predicted TPR repeat methyltransferase